MTESTVYQWGDNMRHSTHTIDSCRWEYTSESAIDSQPCRVLDAEQRAGSLTQWEWLKTPALVLILIGALGILRVYAAAATTWLAFMKFPPVWSCGVMIGGGAILLALSIAASKTLRQRSLRIEKHKNWRSF